MIVKVLQHENGKYLEDYALEGVFDFFPPVKHTILMACWMTDDPRKAMHFYTSMSAIVARNWVGNKFNYKNIEI